MVKINGLIPQVEVHAVEMKFMNTVNMGAILYWRYFCVKCVQDTTIFDIIVSIISWKGMHLNYLLVSLVKRRWRLLPPRWDMRDKDLEEQG